MSKIAEAPTRGLRGGRHAAAVVVAVAGLLAGCGAILKVAEGDVLIKDRLALKVEQPWNQFERGMADNTPTWTNEGVTVDALKFYVGIRDGQEIAPLPAQAKGVQPLVFRATMQPAQMVGLFESMLTRDGSSFKLDRLEPAEFLGEKGFRFEYSLNRKVDDVPMQGMAIGVVRRGELFLLHYSAPRLVFFPRYKARVEAIARSAQVRS
ncbi:hypothetical protein LNV28_02285 [Paucibacter sp. DJ2R-2]|nr:hypothetical protein [Paucibacter sp. DJ2R-2]